MVCIFYFILKQNIHKKQSRKIKLNTFSLKSGGQLQLNALKSRGEVTPHSQLSFQGIWKHVDSTFVNTLSHKELKNMTSWVPIWGHVLTNWHVVAITISSTIIIILSCLFIIPRRIRKYSQSSTKVLRSMLVKNPRFHDEDVLPYSPYFKVKISFGIVSSF